MSRNSELFTEAQRFIPGGVNSPVRAFKAVGGTPPFIERARGAHIYDADGSSYIDYVLSWGPMILGHAHPEVISTVTDAASRGLSFGAPTEVEIEMASKLCEIMPNMDLVRMVNSGTEATMSAIRLARGYTGRDKIIKFEGCYHGHSDSLLIKAGSGALTLGVPSSPGVPACLAAHTITLPYNDAAAIEQAFTQRGEQIAPLGPVYQAGTLAGNPVAMCAGLKTLELISAPNFYPYLFALADQLVDGLRSLASDAGIALTTNHVGSMFGFFFSEDSTITNYQQVMACDNERFNRFFHLMLDQGVYLAPASYEAGFVSSAHTPELIDQTLEAAKAAFTRL